MAQAAVAWLAPLDDSLDINEPFAVVVEPKDQPAGLAHCRRAHGLQAEASPGLTGVPRPPHPGCTVGPPLDGAVEPDPRMGPPIRTKAQRAILGRQP